MFGVMLPILASITAPLRRLGNAQALSLVAPLFLYLLVTFFVPIAATLWQSVSDPLARQALPQTIAALGGFDGNSLPDSLAFAGLQQDLKSTAPETLAKAAVRINSDLPGFRSLLFKTVTAVSAKPATLTAQDFIAIDARWGQIATWAAIKRAGGPLTDANLLAALDLKRTDQGAIAKVAPDKALFVGMLVRTVVMAAWVTFICLIVGFPLAYFIASSPPRRAGFLMIFILLPLWTSILVRTLSWTVLLQREGIINGMLAGLGVGDAPFDLMFNRTAVYVGMTHILLPFMVLALFSVMKSFPDGYLRAASSLGAKPFTVFRRVYLPLVMPGVVSGCLLVFIQALGAYITPVLLGNPNDQTIAPIIAFYVTKSSNWGLAAALSLILLVAIVLLSSVYRSIAGGKTIGVA